MSADPIFKAMVSTKMLIFCKIICIYYYFQNILFGITYLIDIALDDFQYDHTGKIKGFPYQIMFDLANLIVLLITEMTLFYLYYSGLNNINNYWASKNWQEYEKYGENEKVHEKLIVISRCFIGMTVSMMATLMKQMKIKHVLVLVFDVDSF